MAINKLIGVCVGTVLFGSVLIAANSREGVIPVTDPRAWGREEPLPTSAPPKPGSQVVPRPIATVLPPINQGGSESMNSNPDVLLFDQNQPNLVCAPISTRKTDVMCSRSCVTNALKTEFPVLDDLKYGVRVIGGTCKLLR